MVRKSDSRLPNTRLRDARVGRGLKAAECARALEHHAHTRMGIQRFSCSEDKYKTWEAGVRPHDCNHAVLADFFGRSPAELGLIPTRMPASTSDTPSPTVDGGESRPGPQEDDVHRREFMTTIPAAFAAVPLLDAPHGTVGMEHAEQLRGVTMTLRRLDAGIGGDRVRPIADHYLAQATTLLARSRPDRVGAALHSAVGELATAAAWFAHDADEHGHARAYLGEALIHARVADDPELEGYAYSEAHSLALHVGQPAQALRFAQLGSTLAGRASLGRARALFAAFEARAHGALGDRPAADEAIGRAWAHLETTSGEGPPWAAYADEVALLELGANTHAALGEHDQAARGLAESISRAGATLRVRATANRQVLLADARLGCGELDGACEAATGAVNLNVASARVRGRLAGFAARLTRFDSPVARTWVERWRTQPGTPATSLV